MVSLKNFEAKKIENVEFVKGGGFTTEGGSYNKKSISFEYDTDYSTWEEGSMEWEVSYYGIQTCAC